MPRKKELEDGVKVTLRLHRRDYERLKIMYPTHGPQRVIRALVTAHVSKVDRRVAETTERLVPELDIEITEEDLANAE